MICRYSMHGLYLFLKKGIPTRVMEEEAARYGVEEPLEMEYAGRKIRVPKQLDEKDPVTVHPHHLDSNHHVNNGQYVAIAQEYLPEGFEVRGLRAEYRQQARLGDVMVPGTVLTDDVCMVVLNDRNGKPYVIVEFSRV